MTITFTIKALNLFVALLLVSKQIGRHKATVVLALNQKRGETKGEKLVLQGQKKNEKAKDEDCLAEKDKQKK